MDMLIPAVFLAQSVTIDVYPSQWAGWVPRELLSSGDEITQDVSPAGLPVLVAQTGVPILRWGGIAAEYWDWEGFGYEGASYVDYFGSGIVVVPSTCSIDDILQFTEESGAEPVLTVNHQIGDPAKAARLVEYCNGGAETPMGALRAARGHPEPYDVTQWCIGNEPDIAGGTYPTPFGTMTFYRHFGIPFEDWGWTDSVFCTPGQFSDLVGEYASAMRAASPIPIEIGGLSLAGDLSWIGPVMGPNAADVDWMDAHYYPVWVWESDSTMYHDLLWSPDSSSIPLEARYSQIRTALDAVPGCSGIPLWFMEYNVAVMAEDPAWWNYLDGLVVADCIGHLARAGCPAAAVYSIAEGSAGEFPLFGQIRTDTLSARMGAQVLRLYSERFGGILVETDCADAMEHGLEAWSSLTGDGSVSVMAVNRDLEDPVATSVELHGWVPGTSFEVWQITNDAPLGAPWNGTSGIQYEGSFPCGASGLDWTFPPASVTCLVIHPTSSVETAAQERTVMRVQPNPSCGSVDFVLASDAPGTPFVDIYDGCGRLVRRLCGQPADGGMYCVSWDGLQAGGGRCPAGVYGVVANLQDGSIVTGEFVLLD